MDYNQLMETGSKSEIISTALVITVQGLLIVFAVLFILMLILKAIKLFAKEEQPEAGIAAPNQTASPKIVHTVSDVDISKLPESELIAIFSAAIAANTDQSVEHIRIQSYRKIEE